ncbi:hypothetical protein MmiAt1_10280 [Methanimicrococcus sp. At1]|uniref:PIN domain-containing protein n=1 Tax=Methanimicrococcus hacksteinii TaxID=3028293 RepID=A0ABU3VQ64_9EURY|nr:PIN domain-containing protein [Methanimicrococcus sp. At1]MDV0445449.1 hypothetical protein [Methanimicrococcus sp. At1]
MTVYKLADISNIASEKIFIDANILISLDSPHPYFSDSFPACLAARNIFLENKTNLFVDIVVLSEFYNRCLKASYNFYCSTNGLNPKKFTFKKYRKTEDYKINLEQTCSKIQNILQYANAINPNYPESVFISNIIPANFKNLDFNDLHILFVCLHNNFCLWTNDIDFKNQPIDIFTENVNY